MRSVVTGLMMLLGAVVREKGHGFDDLGWRRELQQAREAMEADAATSGARGGDGEAVVVAGPPVGKTCSPKIAGSGRSVRHRAR